MSARKAEVASRLKVRRGLDEGEAAVYLSVSPSFFRTLVERGEMPRPRLLGSCRIWDVDDLDAAFKALPYEDEIEPRDTSWDDIDPPTPDTRVGVGRG